MTAIAIAPLAGGDPVRYAALDLLRRVARTHDGIIGFVPGLAGMHNGDNFPTATTVPGLVVYRYDAPLCFANADNFRHRTLAAMDSSPATPGSCSTPRPTSRSTSPRWTPSTSCAPN